MTLGDLIKTVESELPGWGWLGRSVRPQDQGAQVPHRGRFFANILHPAFSHENRHVVDSSGKTISYSGHLQTNFPAYSDLSAAYALQDCLDQARATMALGCHSDHPTGGGIFAQTVAVDRVPSKFSQPFPDPRPEMPEGYAADLDINIRPSRG